MLDTRSPDIYLQSWPDVPEGSTQGAKRLGAPREGALTPSSRNARGASRHAQQLSLGQNERREAAVHDQLQESLRRGG
jgi:hypothetical protein